MGKRGPKAKPTALKILEGERRPCRTNPDEPKPTRGVPPMPEYLRGEAAEEWGRITRSLDGMGVLSVSDGPMLAIYCEAFQRWRTAIDAVGDKLTFDYVGGNKTDAHVGIAERAEAKMIAILARFGMSPSDRSSIRVVEGEGDPFAAFLAEREAGAG